MDFTIVPDHMRNPEFNSDQMVAIEEALKKSAPKASDFAMRSQWLSDVAAIATILPPEHRVVFYRACGIDYA